MHRIATAAFLIVKRIEISVTVDTRRHCLGLDRSGLANGEALRRNAVFLQVAIRMQQDMRNVTIGVAQHGFINRDLRVIGDHITMWFVTSAGVKVLRFVNHQTSRVKPLGICGDVTIGIWFAGFKDDLVVGIPDRQL